jgi:hypothetical protein
MAPGVAKPTEQDNVKVVLIQSTGAHSKSDNTILGVISVISDFDKSKFIRLEFERFQTHRDHSNGPTSAFRVWPGASAGQVLNHSALCFLLRLR